MRSPISPELVETVLLRLGLHERPDATPEGLAQLYHRWCRSVPFDNILKLIHIRKGLPGPFPGTEATGFFRSWLEHGTGGTCWAGANALHALLVSLGFDAQRGISTMVVAPDIPPNHGTVRVDFGGYSVLVDASILHDEPIPLAGSGVFPAGAPASRVSVRDSEGGRTCVRWSPLHQPDGMDCRIEHFGASHDEYAAIYEATRSWSPFNYQLTARINRDDRVTGLSFGKAITLFAVRTPDIREIDHEGRVRFLIEEMGISEALAGQLPEDLPTPAPPGSSKANRAA
jgi:arylamine N-acetyltransferase